MAIIVEDGTGLETANSFVAVAFADSYFDDLNAAQWVGSDANKAEALIRASLFLSGRYKWKGKKLNARTQALAWPRTDVYDGDEYPVASDAVPKEIKAAVCELAAKELVSPRTLFPEVLLSQMVKSEQIGALRVDYLNAFNAVTDAIPNYPYVLSLISGLIDSAAGVTKLSGVSVRG